MDDLAYVSKARRADLQRDREEDVPWIPMTYPADYQVFDDKRERQLDDQVTEMEFDVASRAWRRNKVRKARGFEYCCGATKQNGQPCRGVPYVWSTSYRRLHTLTSRGWSYCRQHRR
jgi:hypothetical protein